MTQGKKLNLRCLTELRIRLFYPRVFDKFFNTKKCLKHVIAAPVNTFSKRFLIELAYAK